MVFIKQLTLQDKDNDMSNAYKTLTKRNSGEVIFTSQGGGYFYVILNGERVGMIQGSSEKNGRKLRVGDAVIAEGTTREMKAEAVKLFGK